MIQLPHGIKGIIFDCDGTLIDNMHLHLLSWQKAFRDKGCEFTKEFLDNSSGMTLDETVALYNEINGTSLDPSEIVELKDLAFAELVKDAKPVEEICSIVTNNFEKLPMAVVSGSRRPQVDHSLEITQLIDLFDVVLTADDPFPGKPDSALFLEAAKRLGVEPEKCLVFEDGLSGIIGAKKAGMQIIDVNEIVEKQRKKYSELGL
jgi:beta-phosphoglucomutase-like phosphatase (HAD superfamily)